MCNHSQQVLKKNGDSWIYLNLNNVWYCYDSNSIPIGKGAMGTVYLGFNCNTNLRIAVKRVKDVYANNKIVRDRAKQEASLSFCHPNLVQMIGLCEVLPDQGPIFILSEYVSGITLDVHVREQLNNLNHKDKIEKISTELCKVLDALQYLHERGVVHRDVKPSNIMIENGSVIKLMDLGIARLNGGNKYSSCGFVGTPQYAAPEQILRNNDDLQICPQTDIYALGVTYYELLTGKNPFKTDIEADVLYRQIKMKLPYDKRIPRSIFNVILKATEKMPSKRYKTALEFKNAILDAIESSEKKILRDWILINWIFIFGVLVIFLILVMILFTI